MKGSCELFEKGCLGCNGCEDDLDITKKTCPTYVEWKKKFEEGEQMKW